MVRNSSTQKKFVRCEELAVVRQCVYELELILLLLLVLLLLLELDGLLDVAGEESRRVSAAGL